MNGMTSRVLEGEAEHRQLCIDTILDAASTSTSDEKKAGTAGTDEEWDESDDNFGVDAFPRDCESLVHELARLNEEERRLERETAVELKQGHVLLRATQQERLAKASAALKRRQTAARHVLAYAGEKARETYVSRCAELQKEMNLDMERELRRLQTAKDGVSVTSRRRRAVRDETRGSLATSVKPLGSSMRRRRTMYTSDGDEDGPEDVFLASASPEERAQRVQFQEKKRLEQLLGRASVFKPVVKQATAKEIAKDLKTIRSAMACREKHLKTRGIKSDKKKHKAKLQYKQREQQKHQVKKKHQQTHKPKRQRPMVITPRRIPHASGPNLPATATPSHRVASTTRPRLLYNPLMLQEGQEIEVLKRQNTEAVADNADESQDERVMSGIITAATATQVYLLTATGRFESFDVRDCILGSLYVRAAESNTSPKNRVRNDMNTSSAWIR